MTTPDHAAAARLLDLYRRDPERALLCGMTIQESRGILAQNAKLVEALDGMLNDENAATLVTRIRAGRAALALARPEETSHAD